MAFFFRRQARLQRDFENFLGCLERCHDLFVEGYLAWLAEGPGPRLEEAVGRVHQAESDADDLRVGLIRSLYGEELLPDSRGDLHQVLEAADKVANRMEDVLFFVHLRNLSCPAVLQDDLRLLLRPVEQAVATLVAAIRALLAEPSRVREIVAAIDADESASDRFEQALVRRLFALELDLALKVLLDQLIHRIGQVADSAETASRRVDLAAIKRIL